MDDAFSQLKKLGKNNIENILKWLKDSKVIDKTREQDERVRKYFQDVADKNNIPVDKFKEVVIKLACETKKNLEGVTKQLAEHGPQVMEDIKQGAANAATKLRGAVDDTVNDFKCKKK